MGEQYVDKNEIKDFILSCNDFVEGKFILADIKISKILKAISNSTALYDVIAECMINYDFESEFERAKIGEENTVFTLPCESHKLIPFVFCLLVEIDSKRLPFNVFINSQFPYAENQNEQYEIFGKNIIIPFRNAIAELFDVDLTEFEKDRNKKELKQEENIIDKKIFEHLKIATDILKDVDEEDSKKELEEENENAMKEAIANKIVETVLEQTQEDEETDFLFDRIARLTSILDDKLLLVKNPLKKSNISLLIEGLYEACEVKSVKIIVALVMALNNFAGVEKYMRPEIQELNTICYNFYE